MGTIVPRKRRDGSVGYTAQIRIRRDGKIVHSESQTFDRRPAASAWLKRRETELSEPGALEQLRTSVTLSFVIDHYIRESLKQIGRTKAQVLAAIKSYPIAEMECRSIRAEHIVALARELIADKQPQTVGNYLSHLAAVFAIARPAWGYPLSEKEMDDAQVVSKRLGLVTKSKSRDRRPSLEELNKLLDHYADRKTRVQHMAPMVQIILFAIFSTRRQEEITRILWEDFEKDNGRVLVRDMKNPGEKIGNHIWCDLVPEAIQIIEQMPKTTDQIFPYTTEAISASFTRACKFLGIEDLHFHDLRHEGISRLFEMGWNIPHVATVSGHRSWTSLKRYSHIRQTGDKYKDWKWIKLEIAPTPTA